MHKIMMGMLMISVALPSHGLMNTLTCTHSNIFTPTCEKFIRDYAFEQLDAKNLEVHKNRTRSSGPPNPKKYEKDHIVFACHRAVSMNNLVKKVQGKLYKNDYLEKDMNKNIDLILNQYLKCRRGHFGQTTDRK